MNPACNRKVDKQNKKCRQCSVLKDETKFFIMSGNGKSQGNKTDFPAELVAPIKDFQTSLTNVNKVFETLHSQPLQDLKEKAQLDALGKAKIDCTSAFAVNSLVWMWLRATGENPKEAGVTNELERVKKSMLRLKEIQDKAKRVPVDGQAAKRLVKGSLWQAKDKKKQVKRLQ